MYSVQVPATVQTTLVIAVDTSRKELSKVVEFGYDTYAMLTSAEAKKRYRIIQAITLELAIIAKMILKASWASVQEWCDAFVQSCQPPVDIEVVTVETASEDVPMPDTDPVPDEPTNEHFFPVNNGSDMQDVAASAIVLPTPAATPSKPIFELTRAEMLVMAQKLEITGYRKMSNTRLQRKLQQLTTA